jgi:membrane-bound metal-dependent hydrolase YbcI (DUF457 family)
MLPWGHLAVGYLGLTWGSSWLGRNSPGELAVLALVVGTQLPDLVDKPLAWYLAVLPSGRSFGHSLFVAGVVVAAVYAAARRVDRPVAGVAFGWGYLSHLAGDALYPALSGQWAEFAFLFWPVRSVPQDETGYTILGVLLDGTLSPTGLFETALFVVALAVWRWQDFPGTERVRRFVAGRDPAGES